MYFGWPLYEGIGNEATAYAALPAFNLLAPNSLFPGVCGQRNFRFRDLITADSPHPSWPNPCEPSIEVPAGDDVFVRDRPAIDWLHGGADARWAAFDDSGEPLALTLGTRAPNGALVSGPLFGGSVSIGGVWYQGGSFPAPFRNVYYHADSGGEWIKAFAFDGDDNPVAVRDFLATGGPIQALGVDPRTGNLYYVTGPSGSEVHKLTYAPATGVIAASSATSATSATAATPATTATTATSAPTGPAQQVSDASAAGVRIAAASAASSVTAQSTVTPSWSNEDIGSVSAAGSYSVSGGTFTVNGSGADIWNQADAFQFVSTPLTGDGSITARVVSQTNTNGWAKAGVMFRETLTPGATNAFAAITPSNGVVYQARPSTGATSIDVTVGPIVSTPYWVQVVRAGNVFTAYYSANGTTWTSMGSQTMTMASQAYVGLAVSSHNNGTLSTAVFDNVTITSGTPAPQAPTVPTGLVASNVTASTLTLSWTASSNPSSGVGGYYVYRNGSSTPLATVTSGTSYNDSGLSAGTCNSSQIASFDTSTP